MEDADGKIDVLHVIPTLAVGGAENMLATLVTAPRERPMHHAVAYFLAGDQLAEPIRRAGVPVHWTGTLAPWQAPLAVVRLAGLIRRLRPKVVQSWIYYGDLAALWALELSGRRASTRLYWGIRCSYIDYAQYGRALGWAVRWCASHAGRPDAIVANSYVGRQHHRDLGYLNKSFFVIPNGVDTERFHPDPLARARLRSELGLDAADPVVVHVARVDPVKDHALLVAVAETMPAIRFLAAGPDTERLSGPPNLLRLGVRRDVPQLLAAADALVLTSRGEGFPNVVLEAMATALPVVTTDVGDARRIVGDTGAIVPVGDRAGLVAELTKLFAKPAAERSELGDRARTRAVSAFSLAAYVAAFDVLHRSGTGPQETPPDPARDSA